MFKYQVIKNAVSFELANFIFNYFLLKRDAVKFMYDNNLVYDTGMLGTWSDQQVPNTYSHYADMVMETLMMKVLPRMEKETGLKLLPTYSYARIYKKGDILKRHKDGQVFLHYNHVNGPFADKNRFDKRPMLGIPPIRNI